MSKRANVYYKKNLNSAIKIYNNLLNLDIHFIKSCLSERDFDYYSCLKSDSEKKEFIRKYIFNNYILEFGPKPLLKIEESPVDKSDILRETLTDEEYLEYLIADEEKKKDFEKKIVNNIREEKVDEVTTNVILLEVLNDNVSIEHLSKKYNLQTATLKKIIRESLINLKNKLNEAS